MAIFADSKCPNNRIVDQCNYELNQDHYLVTNDNIMVAKTSLVEQVTLRLFSILGAWTS